MRFWVTCCLLITACIFLLPTKVLAFTTGVQIASDKTLPRIKRTDAQYKAIKYQYNFTADQHLEDWIDSAHNRQFKVLISASKNNIGLPPLRNDTTEVSHLYCWYPDELKDIEIKDSLGRVIGTRKETTPENNGYQQYMQAMETLGRRLQAKNAEAVELWNEPNLRSEWSAQGLGELSPENYARFLECGVKGLKKGAGYTGQIISAALAPLSGDYDDLKFFSEFVAAKGLTGPTSNGVYAPNCIGWHGNITKNIPPEGPEIEGFQRYKKIYETPGVPSNLPVCFTEFGWNRKLAQIDRQVQGAYIVNAFQNGAKDPRVDSMYVFNFGFTIDGASEKFEDWDIEGVDLENVCVPGRGNDLSTRDTHYITTPVLDQAAKVTKTMAKYTLPQSVNEDTEKKISLQKEQKAYVTKGFIPETIASALESLCNLTGNALLFCAPHIDVGTPESPTGGDVTGHSTVDMYFTGREVANTIRPKDLALIPEQWDCNILSLGQDPDVRGNEMLHAISEDTGTNTGKFSEGLPQFADKKQAVEKNAEADNINLGPKKFSADRRAPEAQFKCDMGVQNFMPQELAKDFNCTRGDDNPAP
jgi:hypothetical protein